MVVKAVASLEASQRAKARARARARARRVEAKKQRRTARSTLRSRIHWAASRFNHQERHVTVTTPMDVTGLGHSLLPWEPSSCY